MRFDEITRPPGQRSILFVLIQPSVGRFQTLEPGFPLKMSHHATTGWLARGGNFKGKKPKHSN